MSLLYDKVVNIINKPPEKRLDPEIEQILPWFRKRSDLFNSLHADIVRDIVKNCRFEPIDKNQVIIRQMEKGDRYRCGLTRPLCLSDSFIHFYINHLKLVSLYCFSFPYY
ncbi:cAMP-dependent protein kinase regulatory subunit [Elysia marginata]|uniref:cAMP-dependent protein kinase regulatory subunit n=1 Tax=Elysia marginata TaxID=1093978 RepID=A0AAV4FLQ2_9GAST|nr:cAMP-dependent protein kinase regulatory subunit [Elysia marginata]